MKIVCIAGFGSGLGKTSLAVELLARLPGWAACKVTTCVEGPGDACPRGMEESCGVCGSLLADYEIEEEKGAEGTRRKDTGRMLAAGARKVLWVRSKPRFLSESVGKALAIFGDCPGVIFEGNHVLEVLDPDIAVMLTSPSGTMKSSARAVLAKVDIMCADDRRGECVERIMKAVSDPA